MLAKLRDFFSEHIAGEPGQKRGAHAHHLAACALLMEVAYADFAIDPREERAMRVALHDAFALSTDEVDKLLELARSEHAQASSAFQFTRLVNEGFSDAEKSQLILFLWRVALADGNLDKYEEHRIRKISELIYVPHSEFIRRKLEAQTGSAAPPSTV